VVVVVEAAEDLTPIARWGTPADVGRAVAARPQDGFNVDGGCYAPACQ